MLYIAGPHGAEPHSLSSAEAGSRRWRAADLPAFVGSFGSVTTVAAGTVQSASGTRLMEDVWSEFRAVSY